MREAVPVIDVREELIYALGPGPGFTPAEHHEAGRVLPDNENRGDTWKCSCGRLFATAKGRSGHQHSANNRRRRMGI